MPWLEVGVFLSDQPGAVDGKLVLPETNCYPTAAGTGTDTDFVEAVLGAVTL